MAVPAATLFVENDNLEKTQRKAERTLKRRLDAIARMPLCAGLTESEKEHVARHLKFSPFAAGEIISRQGAPARWLYILDKGSVEIRVAVGEQESTVGHLKAPDYFGEHGMMTGSPRTATVVATTEVECFRLDRETLDEILQIRPQAADAMATVLPERQIALIRFREELAEGADRLSTDDRRLQILSRMQEFFGLSGKS